VTATGLELKPGEQVPGTKYQVVRSLGAGGMGIVYQIVKKPNIGGVLKLMSSDLAEHEEHRMRFFDEVRILAQLDHPNIVKVFDYDALPDGSPFYVMELLSGRTVRDVIYTMGRVPPRVAYEVTRQLLEALQCAHTHDTPVIHRDIKPENIFLHAPRHGEPVVKLIDFGVSSISDRKHDGSFVGTWSYAAPEQIRGEKPSPQTDLYAVGLVLYEMLAGVGPFDHYDDWTKVSEAQMKEIPAPVSKFAPWVPASIVALIQSALAKDPKIRPRDAYAFAERLFELEWASDGKNPHDLTLEGPSAAQTPPVPPAGPRPAAGAGRVQTPKMRLPDPVHIAGNGPLSQALHRVTNVGLVAARADAPPASATPESVRAAGTFRGLGTNASQELDANVLLAGLSAEPRKPPSKRERESDPEVSPSPDKVIIKAGRASAGAPHEERAPTTPRAGVRLGNTAVTQDAPDGLGAPSSNNMGRAAPSARDTFSSQSSDARAIPRAKTASILIALALLLSGIVIATIVVLRHRPTTPEGAATTALTAPIGTTAPPPPATSSVVVTPPPPPPPPSESVAPPPPPSKPSAKAPPTKPTPSPASTPSAKSTRPDYFPNPL